MNIKGSSENEDENVQNESEKEGEKSSNNFSSSLTGVAWSAIKDHAPSKYLPQSWGPNYWKIIIEICEHLNPGGGPLKKNSPLWEFVYILGSAQYLIKWGASADLQKLIETLHSAIEIIQVLPPCLSESYIPNDNETIDKRYRETAITERLREYVECLELHHKYVTDAELTLWLSRWRFDSEEKTIVAIPKAGSRGNNPLLLMNRLFAAMYIEHYPVYAAGKIDPDKNPESLRKQVHNCLVHFFPPEMIGWENRGPIWKGFNKQIYGH